MWTGNHEVVRQARQERLKKSSKIKFIKGLVVAGVLIFFELLQLSNCVANVQQHYIESIKNVDSIYETGVGYINKKNVRRVILASVPSNSSSTLMNHSHSNLLEQQEDHQTSFRTAPQDLAPPAMKHPSNGKETKEDKESEPQFVKKVSTFPSKNSPEWIDDIDTRGTSKNPIACGTFKCAFPSKSATATTATTTGGYLVSQNNRNKTVDNYNKGKNQESLNNGFVLATYLASKFHIRHLMLGPPQLFLCTEELAQKLNSQNLYNPSRTNDAVVKYQATTINDEEYQHEQLIVQPIRFVSPNTTIMFKCKDDRNLRVQQQQLKKHVRRMIHDSYNTTAPTPNDELFDENRLQQDINSTIEMLNSKEGNCMFADFQILFDIFQGKIYQIDIDRCYDRKDTKKFKEIRLKGNPLYKNCMKNFRLYAQSISSEWQKVRQQQFLQQQLQQDQHS